MAFDPRREYFNYHNRSDLVLLYFEFRPGFRLDALPRRHYQLVQRYYDDAIIPAGLHGRQRQYERQYEHESCPSIITSMLNITGNRKIWFTISAIFVAIALLAIGFWRFQESAQFKGGTLWEFSAVADNPSLADVQNFFATNLQIND